MWVWVLNSKNCVCVWRHFDTATFSATKKIEKRFPVCVCVCDRNLNFSASELRRSVSNMSSGELLNIEPLELKFPCQSPFNSFSFSSLRDFLTLLSFLLFFLLVLVELKKQISCSLQLSNKTDAYVAFKVTLNFAFVFSD